MYGTLVVNEHVIPITKIELHGGKVLVTAYTVVRERMWLPHGSEFRIHGPDGILVVTGSFQNDGEDLRVEPGRDSDLTIIQPLGFVDKVTVSRPS